LRASRALPSRAVKRVLLAVAVAALVAVGACRLCWPERYAVNAPMANSLFGWGRGAPDARERERLRAPDGFSVSLFADGLDHARWLLVTPAGDLLVSQPRLGGVTLVERDADGDGRSDGALPLLTGLNRPHGLELRDGWLYVAETDAVGRVRFDARSRSVEGSFERFITGLPAGGNHWTRTIRFGPDGLLYLTVGSSCNACRETDPRRAAMLRFRPDGSGEETYATGLRNAVGFDWRPGTDELYATDNGRDLLGDDFPPCELNRIERGAFYGWPVANGDRVPDPDLGAGEETRIAASVPPVHDFHPHNAPLGMTFVRGDAALPAAYRGAALVALHGSWNRTRKDGYKVVSLHWTESGGIDERDFLVGFLQDEDVIGRPVDVVEGADEAFYVSDDYAGVVWRVAWGAGRRAQAASPPAARTAPADPLAALPEEEVAAGAERGRALFEGHGCFACHDPDRAAPGVVPFRLQDLGARYTVESLVATLRTPPPPMPVPDLDDRQRRDLALFLLSR
jgi:glucose/arabinose dehydrogenase